MARPPPPLEHQPLVARWGVRRLKQSHFSDRHLAGRRCRIDSWQSLIKSCMPGARANWSPVAAVRFLNKSPDSQFKTCRGGPSLGAVTVACFLAVVRKGYRAMLVQCKPQELRQGGHTHFELPLHGVASYISLYGRSHELPYGMWTWPQAMEGPKGCFSHRVSNRLQRCFA